MRFIGFAVVILAAACQTTSPALIPLESEDVEVLHKTAFATDNHVFVAVEYDTWPGPASITEEVTPIRVVVENRGTEPIAIRYGDFVLRGGSERMYMAIAPFEIEGSVLAREPHPLLRDPQFEHHRFSVYYPYHAVYPTVSPFTGPYDGDPFYSEAAAHWPRQELPTEEMLERALPEGVLDPGGRVAGFLYFERVDDAEARVVFDARFDSADSGTALAQVDVRFLVTD